MRARTHARARAHMHMRAQEHKHARIRHAAGYLADEVADLCGVHTHGLHQAGAHGIKPLLYVAAACEIDEQDHSA